MAELMVFNEASSGALDDLEKVTKLAYTLVAFYGLSETMGNLSYFDSTGESQQFMNKPYSEDTARIIDEDVRNLVNKMSERTQGILNDHRQKLILLAEELLVKETLYSADLEKILGERSGNKKDPLPV